MSADPTVTIGRRVDGDWFYEVFWTYDKPVHGVYGHGISGTARWKWLARHEVRRLLRDEANR